MLKFFANRGKGSVTVFVTMIMIPTIFFTAFLGDLARVKLYSNIALMTADNYGEDILTEYDDLLRELYGFFSVTQDKEALEALDTLKNYSASSFRPNDNTISYKYLQAILGTTSYDGFMPYSAADVNMSYEFVEGADLNDDEVFATQLGDFMRFRIAQQLLMAGDITADGEVGGGLMDMQKEVQSHEGDMKVIDKQQDFVEELQEYLDLLKDYYNDLYLIEEQYELYRKDYALLHGEVVDNYDFFIHGTPYIEYVEYLDPDNADAIKAAQEKKSKGETLSAEESHLCDIADRFDENKKEVNDFLDNKGDYKDSYKAEYEEYIDKDNKDYKIDDAIWASQEKKAGDDHHVNMQNYNGLVSDVDTLAAKIKAQAKDVIAAKNELQNALNEKDDKGEYKVSEALRTKIGADVDSMDELLSDQVINTIQEMSDYIQPNKAENDRYRQRVDCEKSAFEALDDLIKDGKADYDTDPGEIDKIKEYADEIAKRDAIAAPNFKSFMTVASYKELYTRLGQGFDYKGDTAEVKKEAEENKEKGNSKVDEADKGLDEEEKKEEQASKGVRNIPDSYDFGGNTGGSSSSLKDMMSKVGDLISNGGWGNAGNEALLKLYCVEYDFGMFSSRVTQVRKENKEKNKDADGNFGEKVLDNATGTSTVSLTGYEKCKSINYMYGAELEYVINGSKSAKSNMNYCRNLICGFRMIMNFCSSYSITEVDAAIQAISKAVNAIPIVGPALAIVLEIALRFGFAALETYAEWQKLMKGDKVILYKSKVDELDSLEMLASFLPIGDVEASDDGFGFTYEQYLMIMLIFMTSSEKVFARTQNLIELNMNAVIEEVGEDKNLKDDYANAAFKMKNAHTAVKSTCSVQMDFALIPRGFAKAFLGAKNSGGATYEDLEEFEKTTYQFDVIRGY
ncbi:MAG: hypothetical protein IKP92_09645 [Lachnospiraceae bacterium]|nr:hypothetical protein [Lachnospiraceae bacterium]